MARKGTHRRGKQGVVSWGTSLIAILIGLWPLLANLVDLVSGRINLFQFGDVANRLYNPLNGDRDSLKLGYGALIGGIVFKVATSELTKRAKMRSLIPALHA